MTRKENALRIAARETRNTNSVRALRQVSKALRNAGNNNPLRMYANEAPLWVNGNGTGRVIHAGYPGTNRYWKARRRIERECEQFRPFNNNNDNYNWNNYNHNQNEINNRARRTPEKYAECRYKIIKNEWNMRSMHTGGLIRKSGPHRLLKGEIVLSKAQRQGFTHGQIVKILKFKSSK